MNAVNSFIKNYWVSLLIFSLYLHTNANYVHSTEITSKTKSTLWSKWTVFKKVQGKHTDLFMQNYKNCPFIKLKV